MGTIVAYSGEIITVDDHLVDSLSRHRWHVNSGYVRGYVNGKNVKLHRYIMDPHDSQIVDHINHDPMDNRMSNLRVCSHAQNMANRVVNRTSTSGLKGVNYDKSMKRRKRWAASIHHNGKRIKIGRYFTKEEAAEAYDRMAATLKGEFSNLNMNRGIVS